MVAQEVLSGIQIHRNGRYPYDYEAVHTSYSDMTSKLISDGHHGTTDGTFYAGMITSVVDDNEKEKNGPWYISYEKSGVPGSITISYYATRIPLATEIESITSDWDTAYSNLQSYVLDSYAYNIASYNNLNTYLLNAYAYMITSYNNLYNYTSYMLKFHNTMMYQMLDQPEYTKPKMTIQFLSAANKELTVITTSEAVYEDVEIGTIFNAGIKVNWEARTLDNPNGTRAYDNIGDPSKPNELLGYSYGVNGNGISFNFLGNRKNYNTINNVINLSTYVVNSENPITIFDNISIAYQKASYMYYPQFYKHGRYENAYGESNTSWFDSGIYTPSTTKYIVNGKYRYYWGFSNDLPMDKEDLQNGFTGLLNNTKFLNGTVTSTIVGDGYNKTYFWVAFPSMYGLTEYNENYKVLIEQSDGIMFDLVSHNQNMSLKHMSVKLGDTDYIDQYKVAFFKFETPIGNASSVVSFRILPEEAINYIYNITDENGNCIGLEHNTDEDFFRTETSNNIIYEEEIFK